MITERRVTVPRIDDENLSAGTSRSNDEAKRRIALVLGLPVASVEGNLPGALQSALATLPWNTRLRRNLDRTILADVRHLLDAMERDDLRRPQLSFQLEHAERRSRL